MSFFAWVYGAQGSTDYGPGSPQSEQMRQSAIARKLRQYYLNKYNGSLCKDWQRVSNFKASSGPKQLVADIPNGTAQFVGSADGEVETAEVDLLHCKVRAQFRLINTTSLTSLLYGVWSNSWNVTTPGRPFANWTQTYEWYESFDCKCCEFDLLSVH